LNFFGPAPLNCTHNDIFATLVPSPSLIEHAIGFTYTRGITKKDLEPCAPLLGLFGLRLKKQAFGTRAQKLRHAHYYAALPSLSVSVRSQQRNASESEGIALDFTASRRLMMLRFSRMHSLSVSRLFLGGDATLR
jgi:hypothetical protein